MEARLLPPRERCGYFLNDREGTGHRVVVGNVDGVVSPSVAPLGVPAFYAHRVALLMDMDRVVDVDAVALVPGEVGSVRPDRLVGHDALLRLTRRVQ